MHISEGVLSAPVLLGGGAIAAVGTAIGLKRIDYDKMMTVALFGSAFFVASFIHVPIGPVSVHLLLSGLLGLILGWSAFPAILAALFLQAVMFQYGGMLVLGVNTAIIAAPAVAAGLILKPALKANGNGRKPAFFLAGFLPIIVSTVLMAGCLVLTNTEFQKASYILILWNIPVAVLEGLITMFTVEFLARVQPEILNFTPTRENENSQ